MVENQENHELKNAGLKITAPRIKILQILEKPKSRFLLLKNLAL